MQPYHHFTLEERESLYLLKKERKSLREISKVLGKNISSISRELKRNRNKDGSYQPWRATVLYICRRKNCKRKYFFSKDEKLKEKVKGMLKKYWSPEIISSKCTDTKINIKTIYSALYRGEFSLDPKKVLRRRSKHKTNREKCNTVHPDRTIHERPDEANERSRVGDWEGDTVYGAVGKGYLVTCVDRKTRFLVAAICRNKINSNIVAALKEAFANASFKELPIHTMTLDNGSEFGYFRDIEKAVGTTIYFADSHSPWQRGSNENINDLIRFFFPKGTDFLSVPREQLDEVLNFINNRPRKCLDWLSPIELLTKICCT